MSHDLNRCRFQQGTRLQPRRSGVALLLALFFVFASAITTLSVMDTLTGELSALRNAVEYERALQLANAGVHSVAAELEADSNWRGTLTDGSYPADDTFTATAVTGANHTVVVTAKGASHSVIRTVTAVIEL